MKQPNFFIIGAPKCGTTSLAEWLRSHPNIFVSNPKEPQYFNTDYSSPDRPSSIKEYEKLFMGSSLIHKAVGEATTGYLMSKEAVANILRYNPVARFIVCLRSPIDMAQSQHAQLLKSGIEAEPSFEIAWDLQEARQHGQKIPITCHEKKILFYGESSKLGKQMQRLFQIVPRKRILVIFLEDMKISPEKEYRRVLEFLGVGDDGRKHFPVENVRAVPRYPKIAQTVRLLGLMKIRFGLRKSFRLGSVIYRLNNQIPKRNNMSKEMKDTLRRYFKNDIELLATLLDRDLSHWVKE